MTVIEATTGAVVVLVATNEAIFPVPLAARPMLVALLVQANVVVPPVLVEEKFAAIVELPLQRIWFPVVFTSPVGLTVIVKDRGVPGQPTVPLV